MRILIVAMAALSVSAAMVGVAQAGQWGPDFSADMVLTNPENTSQSKTAGFAASKGRSATTSRIPKSRAAKQGLGRVQVDIVNPYLGAVWRTFPDSSKYYERKLEVETELPAPPLPGDSSHPCNTDDDIECTDLGAETVNGRRTEKWQLVSKSDHGEVTTTLWFDNELGIPVRELVPGKMMRELKNVKVGPQPDTLFMVPDGFEKLVPKQP